MAAGGLPAGGLWVALFAGRHGKPVYWLTRGTEYVVVDGVATPVKGRVGVLAALARPLADGAVRVSYLLLGRNVTATGHELVSELAHPITGAAISTAATQPLQLGWTFGANGDVTEDLTAANGTQVAYRGKTWETPSTGGGARSATLMLNIRLQRPNGDVETLAEVSVSRPRGALPSAATASAGFIAADSETFTTREVLDRTGLPGRLVYSLNGSHAGSHRSAADLRRALRPGEADALAPFFDQQAGWARDTG